MRPNWIFKNILSCVSTEIFEKTSKNLMPHKRCLSSQEMFKPYILHECPGTRKPSKISVIGCGQVGLACILGIMNGNMVSELALVDANKNKMMGDLIDFQDAAIFNEGPKLSASSDFHATEHSDVIVVTAGARQEKGQSRLDLLGANQEIFKNMIPKLCELSPNAVLLIITNPCDILAYSAQRFSKWPINRVLGSGTNLDTGRFIRHGANNFRLPGYTMTSMVLGEHGESSVTSLSNTSFYGNRINQFNDKMGATDDPEKWQDVKKTTVDGAAIIQKYKGYTNWGIGYSTAQICSAIVRDTREIRIVSTWVEPLIQRKVYMGIPCVLGRGGVLQMAKLDLTDCELQMLQKSADVIEESQKPLKF